jgi:site-specific DNA-methyltransferase (adenine-specific)
VAAEAGAIARKVSGRIADGWGVHAGGRVMVEMPTDAEPVKVVEGDCLEALRELPDACVDAVVTDPPYSSGGFTRGDRQQGVAAKYQQAGTERQYPPFSGDNRDSRSWAFWCTLWLSECRRVTKPGGYCLLFTDWRQLPATTDVFQAGEWQWRGIVSWDKGRGSRAPHKGYFRHQCEYAVWGTNGHCDVPPVDDPRGGPWAGSFTVPVRQDDKHHLTGKPTPLMRELVKVCPPGGLILDPFAGSGTTAVAAALEGRRCLLIEKEPAYAAIARRRVSEVLDAGLFA